MPNDAHMNWPADSVSRRAISDLIPYARNARQHSPEQIAQLAASIREWGWTMPILVDEEGGVIAGHGRILAARQLGIEDAPCMVASGWSEAKKRAYILADNKLALNATWDEATLALELQDIEALGFDQLLTGFNAEEIGALTISRTDGLTDPDDAPEIEQSAVSVLGDTWLLGNHQLRCGDSTNTDDVASTLNGVTPLLMVTDPPYGVEYDANWRNETDRANGKAYGARAIGKVMNDGRADWSEAWALFPGDVAYVWCAAGPLNMEVFESLRTCDFEPRMQVIWAKPRFVIGRGHYHMQHEPCWYAVRKGKTGHWQGDRTQSTLWSIEHRKSETGHSTQKPIECMRRPIVNNSSPGQAVYEPFSGSGTTIIACEMEGRSCHAIELNPLYVDMAIRRWQAFTGQQATLSNDGRTFDEIAEERCALPAEASSARG